MDSLINIIKLYLKKANRMLSKLKNNLTFMYNKHGSLAIMYKTIIDERLKANAALSITHKMLIKENSIKNNEISRKMKSNEELKNKITILKELLIGSNAI